MTAPITDLDAERALLTACLAAPANVSKSLEHVSPGDLYEPLNRMIYSTLVDLDGTGWDPVSVAREIRRQSCEADARRAIALMVELGGEPVQGNVTGHARAIAEAAMNRRLIQVIRSALASAESRRPNEALEILSEIDKLAKGQANIISLRPMMLDAYNLAKEPRSRSTLTWGHYQLDEMTGGLHPGHVGVIGAASSQGKSSKAIAMADENIKRGARAMIVSLEDGPRIYGNRFLARRSGVSAKAIRDHALDASDHSPLAKAVQDSQDVPVFLHCEDMPWERIAILIDQAILRHSIDLVILDYIQECWCETRYQSRQLELQAVARRFRAICRKRNRAGIILTQLTGTEKGKAPNKEMARECKDIVNGAEQVLLLYTGDDGEKMANLDKAKDGTTGIVQLAWNETTASYERVARLDEAMAWADDRFDGFSGIVDDLDNAIGG